MPRPGTTVFILAATVLIASATGYAQESSDMARCAELENAEARLACYDEVTGRSSSSRPAPEVTSPSEPAPDDDSPSEPAPLTEDVGKPDAKSTFVRGRVTGCQKDINDKLYFIFDNGQVWKQRGNARLRASECDFWVTITEDALGYKMEIEGDGKQSRVGRIR